jgi:hypothetical protein
VSFKGICSVKCTVYGFRLYYPIFFNSLATIFWIFFMSLCVIYRAYLSRIYNLHKNQYISIWNFIWKWSSSLCACALWYVSGFTCYMRCISVLRLLYFRIFLASFFIIVSVLLFLSLVTGLFFLVLLLNQQRSPLLRLQVSDCSTFVIMFDVPNIAVFCL